MYVKIRLNTFIIIMCIFLLGVSFQSKYRANTFLSHVMCFHSKANPYIINVRIIEYASIFYCWHVNLIYINICPGLKKNPSVVPYYNLNPLLYAATLVFSPALDR